MAGEDKREKFKRLAEARVRRAIKTIRLIGNLSNKNNYGYTDEQVERIVAALNKEVRDLRSRFSQSGSNGVVEFRL